MVPARYRGQFNSFNQEAFSLTRRFIFNTFKKGENRFLDTNTKITIAHSKGYKDFFLKFIATKKILKVYQS